MNFDYDLIVIGAGSGGVRAARKASEYGAKVAIVEEYRIGGTCVIRGCVPKKLLVNASHFSDEFNLASSYGWEIKANRFNWNKFVAAKNKEITRLSNIYTNNLTKSKVDIIDDRGEFLDKNSIILKNSEKIITADKILIAVGATPFIPSDLKGKEYIITSNEAFNLKELPNDIIIVGGGYIAVEFAGIFNGLGVNTTLIYRGDNILRGFDKDLRDSLHKEMIDNNINIITNDNITAIKKEKSFFAVELKSSKYLNADKIMYATGRIPKIQGLNIENIGIKLDSKNAIIVDDYSKTNIGNIFAVGDVTNRINLTPVAIREGASFAETTFNNNPIKVDYNNVATAVFSQPEIGTVGLTEEEAKKNYSKIEIYKTSFSPLSHSFSDKKTRVLMKLIVAKDNNKVVGCHIIGKGSGELIQILGILMKTGATKDDFDATIAVHPTIAEELVTMHNPI